MLKRFKRNCSAENLAKYLRAKSQTRRAIRESRKKSWSNFCESINLRTSSAEVYRKIKSLKGLSAFHRISAIEDNDKLLTSNDDIANFLAQNFARNSSSSNFAKKFYNYSRNTNFSINFTNNHEVYNEAFTLIELKSALGSCKGTSPGPDNIRYEMFKKLDTDATKYLLDFYNII